MTRPRRAARGLRVPRRAAAALLAAAVAVALAGAAGAPGDVPAIVFVSREPLGAPGAVPGLGPAHRAAVSRGRLLVRERSGAVRALVSHRRFRDVADPSVSWDGARVAFAAVEHPDSAWRIWVVDRDGGRLAPVTRTDPEARAGRHDDFDPAWLHDGRIVFASTRFPLVGQRGGAVTNLFVVRDDGGGLERITTERNGAEEPSVDPASGRVVYARWWFNRFLASDRDEPTVTTDPARAVAAERVDLWQAVSVLPDGDGVRLAGGNPRERREMMAYQPIVLDDGTLIGVRAAEPALAPAPGALTVVAFPGGFGDEVALAGAGAPAGGRACAPAALADGGLVFSWDPRGDRDFGLWWLDRAGGRPRRLYDRGRTHELDAAPLVRREAPEPAPHGVEFVAPPEPFARLEDLLATEHIVRFDCANAFANGPVDSPFPDAVAPEPGVRIRFFAALARPAAEGGDTLVLVHEAPVTPHGGIAVDRIPADVPMFEQLVGADGRVLRSAMGPAHVPGFNFARPGGGTKCVGCHIGHSAQSVAANYTLASWTNLSPAATATATGSAAGTAGPRAAVDRRARAEPRAHAWVGEGPRDVLSLRWARPIEVAAVVLYAVPTDPASGTDLRVEACGLDLFLEGNRVGSREVARTLTPEGVRVELEGLRLDSLAVRPTRLSGRVGSSERFALAEVEAIARLADD